MISVRRDSPVKKIIEAFEGRDTITFGELLLITDLSATQVSNATKKLRDKGLLEHLKINGRKIIGVYRVLQPPEMTYQNEKGIRQRKKILDFLRETGRPVKSLEIEIQCGLTKGQRNFYLKAMLEEGTVEKIGYGTYRLKGEEKDE